MSPTEIQLLAIYRGPVPVAEISKRWLNLSPEEATKRAALNTLPFPTYRLTDSRKAPLLVSIEDLAHHIDETRRCAKASWEHSQV